MLVTHRLLAKLFAYAILNAEYVCIYEVSQTVQLSWKKMPTPGCGLQDSRNPNRLAWNFPGAPLGAAVFSGSDLGRWEPEIACGGLLADILRWQKTPVAFTVAGPPFMGCRGFVSVPSRRRLQQGAWWYHTSANDSAESRYLKLKLTRLWSYCAGFVYVIYSRGKVLCSFVDWQEVFISYNVPVLIWFSCFYPSMWQWCGILTVSQQSSVGSIKLMWLLVKYWLTIFLGWALTRVVVGKLWFSFVISFHLILMCGVMYMVVIFF